MGSTDLWEETMKKGTKTRLATAASLITMTAVIAFLARKVKNAIDIPSFAEADLTDRAGA
jgi:hypothetical protein